MALVAVAFVGTFKLDTSFRWSRLRVTGPRSVVCGRAYIDVAIRPLGAPTGAAPFELLTGTNPRTGSQWHGTLEPRDISNPESQYWDNGTSGHWNPDQSADVNP